MDRRFIGILLFILLVMATIPMVGRLLGGRGDTAQESSNKALQTLELDSERRVHLTLRPVQPLMSMRLALYYEVEPSASNDRASRAAFFGSLPPNEAPPHFITHMADGGELAGVAAASDPNALLILQDFETGASWPRHDLMESPQQLNERGEKLMQRLSRELPEMDFRLVQAEGLRPLEDLIDLSADESAAPAP